MAIRHPSSVLVAGAPSVGSRGALFRRSPIRLGFNAKCGVFLRCRRVASRNIAVCGIGFAEMLADAINNLPLNGVEDNVAGKQVAGVLRTFSGLPDSSKWEVLVASAVAWFYLTTKPGVLIGAVDAYLLAPLQTVADKVMGRRNLKRSNFIVGQRLGEGSFGTVFTGALVPSKLQKDQELSKRTRKIEEYEGYKDFQKVTLKKVKLNVEGAKECGDMEEWFNYRMARAAPDVCADFLGSFVADTTRGQFIEGGKWLVWKYEGDATLADAMQNRNFPENLADGFLKKMKEKDPVKRKASIIREIMRQIITALKKMHAIGIVHRDVKPANIVLTDKGGKLKFIDFGAATDLRVGKNYVPENGLLDPDYCPPELLVMPEETPRPPPAPIAAALSPILWQLNKPDLFDMYSAGIILLQMSATNLRSSVAVKRLKEELEQADYDLNLWRKRSALRVNLEILDVGAGRGWDLATKLVCKRDKRLSASAALRHPYFLLGL